MGSKTFQPAHYFDADRQFGLNDWEPVAAFARGLLENSEDESFCWPNVRRRILEDNSLLSQTLIQHIGQMRDRRGISIIIEKLKTLDHSHKAIKSPLNPTFHNLESVCLDALARIGGTTAAAETVTQYRQNPDKTYLADEIRDLHVETKPATRMAPCPADFPAILKSVRSFHDILGEGGCQKHFSETQTNEMLNAFRRLKWPGIIETLSGDGQTSTFKLKNKITDHIHNVADPFSDFGIFLSNPKIEYPIGRKRWANSHTFLYFPVADGDLYDKEYTWDVSENTITTHFHRRIPLEKVTVNPDGKSVTVAERPISTGIALRGNIFSKECCSAVRGVWDNPDKTGENYYVKRATVLTSYKKLYYFKPFHRPVVNQLGIWVVHEEERPERFFDADGHCLDIDAASEELLIPLREPKILAWDFTPYRPQSANDPYVKRIIEKMRTDLVAVPDASVLDAHIGAVFEHSRCGFAGIQDNSINGYMNGLDLNADGIIDHRDREILTRYQGKVYRMNVGDFGYFGCGWLSIGNIPRSHTINDKLIFVCCYDYGAGYSADEGRIELFKKATPGQTLYVEYYCDKPADEGENNIKVYLHPPID